MPLRSLPEVQLTQTSHQDPKEQNANLIAMLLANLAKYDGLKSLSTRKQTLPTSASSLGSDDLVLNQLMDLFVKGADGSYNPHADFDYLAYVFADIAAQNASMRRYLVTEQAYDGIVPLSKILVFTEHRSDVRRKGVASAIKNVAFEVDSHADLLDEDRINVLPYVLLPIVGGEEYDEDEMADMLPDLQLLPPDKTRDPEVGIVQTHVETLTLLTTTRAGRELMRRVKVYPVIRETHARVEDEGVQEACERLVQVLMRDEADDEELKRIEEVGDDDRIEEV